MSPRLLPPLAALLFLTPALLWNRGSDRPAVVTGGIGIALPDVPPMPDSIRLPAHISLFDRPDSVAENAHESPEEREAPRKNNSRLHDCRLCAYAGGRDLWVAGLEDADGHYRNIRSGECLPDSGLCFQGIEFVSTPGGMQEAFAIFVDNRDSVRVGLSAANPHPRGQKEEN